MHLSRSATESLGFSDNGFKTAYKKNLTICTHLLGWDTEWGEETRSEVGQSGACPRALCACFALQYGRTISNLLPMALHGQ